MKWISKRYLNGEATAVLGIAVPQPIRLCRINAGEVKFEPDETLWPHDEEDTDATNDAYPLEVILRCVRWYVAYSLSLRNLEAMMAARHWR
jgi:hypothetical protein